MMTVPPMTSTSPFMESLIFFSLGEGRRAGPGLNGSRGRGEWTKGGDGRGGAARAEKPRFAGGQQQRQHEGQPGCLPTPPQ